MSFLLQSLVLINVFVYAMLVSVAIDTEVVYSYYLPEFIIKSGLFAIFFFLQYAVSLVSGLNQFFEGVTQ